MAHQPWLSAEKESHHRQVLWGDIIPGLVCDRDRPCLILPGGSDAEIRVARQHGFTQLIGIENDPHQDVPPGIPMVHADLSQVLACWPDFAPPLLVIHEDSCGSMQLEVVETVAALAVRPRILDGIIAFNLAKSRFRPAALPAEVLFQEVPHRGLWALRTLYGGDPPRGTRADVYRPKNTEFHFAAASWSPWRKPRSIAAVRPRPTKAVAEQVAKALAQLGY